MNIAEDADNGIEVNLKFIQADLIFFALYCASQILYLLLLQIKLFHNRLSSKPVGTILPTVCVPFVSMSYFGTLPIFQTFSLLLYLLGSSVISNL